MSAAKSVPPTPCDALPDSLPDSLPDLVAAPVTDHGFRMVFRDHAARVAVVTGAEGDRPFGFTVTSLASVSLDPPMVSFAVARRASVWEALSRTTYVAVHLLAEGQQGLAARFATSGVDRFAGVGWRPGPDGEPLLDGCAAYLACEVVRRVPAGDHDVVLATVTRCHLDRSGDPLLYHDGHYAALAGEDETAARLSAREAS